MMKRTLYAVAMLLLCSGFGPATEPSDSDTRPAKLSREQKVDQLLAHLTREYGRQLSSKDWVTRSVATISLAQFPIDDATKALVERLTKESHPVGKLIVWQSILSRASLLSDDQFKKWQEATTRMMRDDLFQGDLRIGLLEMLSTTPLTRDNRRFIQTLFAKTNSLDSTDVPTLVALGRAIRAWAEEGPVDDLLAAMKDKNAAVRAKLVLKAAGADLKLDADDDAFRNWWKENKVTFTRDKSKPEARGALRSQYIDPPIDPAKVDPDAKEWHEQLELGALSLGEFDFALAVDCSRSMGGELARVKRDMLVMYTAFAQVAQHARVGITGFSTQGQTRMFLKLTDDRSEITKSVNNVELFSTPGEEEWAGGLDTCIKSNNWRPIAEKNHRVIVMITDEPMTPDQVVKARAVMTKAAKEKFRLYEVLVLRPQSAPDPFRDPHEKLETGLVSRPRAGSLREQRLRDYEELAALTGGRAVIVQIPQGVLGLGTAMKSSSGAGGGGGGARTSVPTGPADIAPVYPNGGPMAHLLSLVLADAINPQYAKRVEPLTQILIAHNQRVSWVAETR